jgi:hypothetical protein
MPRRAAHVRLIGVIASAMCLGVAAAAASTPFPKSIYPAPSRARAHGALTFCPDEAGLESFTRAARLRATAVAESYGRISQEADLRSSDRAWWPEVRTMWRSGRTTPAASTEMVDGSQLGAKMGYATIVRHACGEQLVEKSLSVAVGPRQTHPPYCDACITSLFFIDRRGRSLLYFMY